MSLFWTLFVMAPTVPVIGWLGSLAYDMWLGIEEGELWFEKYEEKIVLWGLVLMAVIGIPLFIIFLIFLVEFIQIISIS